MRSSVNVVGQKFSGSVGKPAQIGVRFHFALFGPIVAALEGRPICLLKCGEKLLHEFVLVGLRNYYVNEFQARGCGRDAHSS